MESNILYNVHVGLETPGGQPPSCVAKDYGYYHYCIDGFDDIGWGCGYRTLQTICSWVHLSASTEKKPGFTIPSVQEIQKILINIGDKKDDFFGTKSWIGSFEACLVLDELYDIQSKIVHIRPGCLNVIEAGFLKDHFMNLKSPVMMGGDFDNASKCILGIIHDSKLREREVYLLVLDPHFTTAGETTAKDLQRDGWVSWRRLSDFDQNSFYNFCLPQVSAI